MAQQANQPLPGGHMLEEYTIDRQLSLGGFSIVYLATDLSGKPVSYTHLDVYKRQLLARLAVSAASLADPSCAVRSLTKLSRLNR